MELPLEIEQYLPSKGQLPRYNGGDRAERRGSSHIPSSESETTMSLKATHPRSPGPSPQRQACPRQPGWWCICSRDGEDHVSRGKMNCQDGSVEPVSSRFWPPVLTPSSLGLDQSVLWTSCRPHCWSRGCSLGVVEVPRWAGGGGYTISAELLKARARMMGRGALFTDFFRLLYAFAKGTRENSHKLLPPTDRFFTPTY